VVALIQKQSKQQITQNSLTHTSTNLLLRRGSRVFYRVVRATRGVRSLRFLIKTLTSSTNAARHKVGGNKKRYIDLENSFDLDLAYINNTRDLIVMSVPAAGKLSLFRNPIWEVERFFNFEHKGSWRIYNCCPELPYRDLKGGAIMKFTIQDHSPPTMKHFVDFLNDAGLFMAQEKGRVVAVHCKGGKGRSGSLCCAWLLYSRECETADAALEKVSEWE